MPSLRHFETRRTYTYMSPSARWQQWIDKVYRRTKRRSRPLLFAPPARCIAEQCLSGNLILMDENLNVFDGERPVGSVSAHFR